MGRSWNWLSAYAEREREREREREKEGLYVGLRVPSLGIEWDGNSNGGVNNF